MASTDGSGLLANITGQRTGSWSMRARAIMHTGCAWALKSTSTRRGEAEEDEHEEAEEQVSAQGEAQRRPGSRVRWPQRPRFAREQRRRGSFSRKECSLVEPLKRAREATLGLKLAMSSP